jgi:hypothetical protein
MARPEAWLYARIVSRTALAPENGDPDLQDFAAHDQTPDSGFSASWKSQPTALLVDP